MANTIDFILTTAASDLMSKTLGGKTLNFTRMAVGDGFSYDTTTAKGYKTLVNEVLSLDITKKETLSASSVRITSAFKNTDTQKEFYYREVGLYAQDPDTGEEVLYAYGNRNDAAELITPSGSSVVTKQLVFIIAVGDSANVTFNVNADVYALQEDVTTLQTTLQELNRTKANKDSVFTLANMGQDVKEAMTGGSVAVIGKNTLLQENIVDKQITPITTNFFDIVNHLSLANFRILGAYVDDNGTIKGDTDTISLVMKVDENSKYVLKAKNIKFNRANIVGSTQDNFEKNGTGTYLGEFTVKDGTITFATPTGISWVCVYAYTGSEYSIGYVETEKYNIYLYKDKIPQNEYDTIKKEYLPRDILYTGGNIAEYVRSNSIEPYMTSFFQNYNQLGGLISKFKNGSCSSTGEYMDDDQGKVLIFKVEGNKKYYIQLPKNSNRNFFIESSDDFINKNSYDIVTIETISDLSANRIFSFTTALDTKYVLSYCYRGSDDVIDVNDYFITNTLEDIGKKPYIRDEYIKVIPKEYENKKTLTIGDSITAINENESMWDRSWRKYYKEIMNPSQLSNTAVSGATWRDKTGTIYDGNPVINGSDGNKNNVIGNQIEKILRGKDTTHPKYVHVPEFDDFDIIIIACGTNDENNTIPTDAEIESQFHNGSTPISNLSLLDRKTWAGAIRYSVDQLRRIYPNAQIFLSTPIQKTGNSYSDIINKNAIIKKIGKRLSVPVIDSIECGVYDMSCPSLGQEGDYHDGLHLSPQGAKKLGVYIANYIKMFL